MSLLVRRSSTKGTYYLRAGELSGVAERMDDGSWTLRITGGLVMHERRWFTTLRAVKARFLSLAGEQA